MIEIDLTGPQGNAIWLMGQAERWCKQLGIDAEPILEDMRSGNYQHLLEVLREHFGEYVELVGGDDYDD